MADVDVQQLALGRREKREDARTLLLARYLAPQLPPAPPRKRYDQAVASWPMLGNDRLGDCVPAGQLHGVQAWTANAGRPWTPTDADALDAYARIGGYRPGDPSTDQGCVELDAMNVWRTQGVGGHTIGAFVAVDPANLDHVRLAVYLLGGALIGADLPVATRSQVARGRFTLTLGPDAAAGSWGGHALWVVGYDRTGAWLVTWGRVVHASWAWWRHYVDEAYAAVSNDWLTDTGKAPSGFLAAELNGDLAALAA